MADPPPPPGENEDQHSDRAVVSLLASLAATVAYAAGLNPPGGVWVADDRVNGYIAGLPIMRDKNPIRYKFFYYSNTTAFVLSLVIAAMLMRRNIGIKFKYALEVILGCALACLAVGYIAGSSVDFDAPAYYGIVLSVIFMIFIVYERGNALLQMSG